MTTLWMVAILSLSIILLGIGLLQLRGFRLLSVQTASMVPTFRPGDALLVKPLRNTPPLGSVISYHSPKDPRIIISHRVVAFDARTGLITTAGDALGSHDQPVLTSAVIGQAMIMLPSLGLVLDFLHRPIGLLLVLYIPATAIVVFEVRKLAKYTQRPQYRHASRSYATNF